MFFMDFKEQELSEEKKDQFSAVWYRYIDEILFGHTEKKSLLNAHNLRNKINLQ